MLFPPTCTLTQTCTNVPRFFTFFLLFIEQCALYNFSIHALPYKTNTEALLFGDKNLSYLDSLIIFNVVHKYIISSKRFNTYLIKINKYPICNIT